MKFRTFLLAVSPLLLAACATLEAAPSLPADHNGPPEVPKPVAQISAERMSEITRILASDEFQGRSMGTAGEDKTIAYPDRAIPGGGARARRRERRMDPDRADDPHQVAGASQPVGRRRPGKTTALRFPDDIYLSTVRRSTVRAIANAPMVFVGYGVNAPERGWDDFKGVDLKGKVAVFLVNDPDFEAAAGEAGRGQVRRQDDDLLRPLDLQVRGSGAARGDRCADRP